MSRDFHYHANHVDAPARGAKAAAMKDARELHVNATKTEGWLVDPLVTFETVRDHGVEFPAIITCRRQDCTIKKTTRS